MTYSIQDKDEERETYKIFKKYLRKVESITNKDDWFEFISAIMGTVETMYGKDSTKHDNLVRLLHVESGKEALECAKKSLMIHLEANIDEIKRIGIHQPTVSTPIVNNQFSPNISQTSNINVIVSTLTEQLPPITLNEIKDILNSKETSIIKKNKILEAIKNTGENIIAKTLTEVLMKAFTGQ